MKLTVFSLKDLLKYLVKITIVVIAIVLITRYFLNKKPKSEETAVVTLEEVQEKDEIMQKVLISILDKTIPNMEKINEEEAILEKETAKGLEPLKMLLASGLPMIEEIKNKPEEIKQNEVNEQENEIKQDEVEIQKAQTDVKTEKIPNNVPDKHTNEYNGVYIKNGTDHVLTKEMLTPDINIENKNIILFHTHTCESYTPSEKYNYMQTGNFRTTDLNFSVARVGTELKGQLNSYGFNVIHDTTYHDYPAYNGSYGRSMSTVENLLKQNSADIIIDLHRDAIGDSTYAPTVKIGEEYASQLMFVIGTDGSGLPHENWLQNLKFAVKVQEKANELYPELFKSIVLRNSRYNQQLGKGACIIEVGATGNTLEQSMNSMKYLAKVLDEIVN